ncbi:MAG: glycosyltransferase [Acidimicrobiia bacterium]|nr:glycosyltransferase [Acidimicrobiia bacterium]
MKPKVTVVTSVHPPDDPRILHKTVGSLFAAGWDVTYLSPAPGPSDPRGARSDPLEGTRAQRSAAAGRRILSADDDVTIVHDPELLPAAIVAGMRRGKERVVFDVHEDIPRQLMTRTRTPGPLRRLSAAGVLSLLRLAERTLTLTLAEPNYGWMFHQDHPVFENRPLVGSLPVRAEDARGIVYVGDITEARGIPLLIRATGRSRDRSLTLIGRCAPSLEEELRSLAGHEDVSLEMPGFLPYDEAWQAASRHLVGVSPLLDLPNYRWSLPTKIDEYRSVGLVVVTSDLPRSVEAVEGSDAALVFPAGDVSSLSDALDQALGDPRRHEAALAEAAGVRERSRWDDKAFADFYATLLTSGQ